MTISHSTVNRRSPVIRSCLSIWALLASLSAQAMDGGNNASFREVQVPTRTVRGIKNYIVSSKKCDYHRIRVIIDGVERLDDFVITDGCEVHVVIKGLCSSSYGR